MVGVERGKSQSYNLYENITQRDIIGGAFRMISSVGHAWLWLRRPGLNGSGQMAIEGELPMERCKFPNGCAGGCEAWLCLAASSVSFPRGCAPH